MNQIEKILHFFLDFLLEWCKKLNSGSVSLHVHFTEGRITRSIIEQKLSVPSSIVKK